MAFRLVEQRHVSSEVCNMEWSPTMDLIALVTAQGEVLLHRLSWQRVWTIPPRGKKDKEVKVNAIAWRPDGKVLAIAYDTINNIYLADVENAETIHLLEIGKSITFLKWVECSRRDNRSLPIYTDNSSMFLPKYYSLVKNFSSSKPGEENVEEPKKVKEEDRLNILVVGTEEASIHLYAFGMFHFGYVELAKGDVSEVKVLGVSLDKNFGMLSAFLECVEDGKMVYRYQSFHLSLLQQKTEELRIIAFKYGQISALLTFLSATMRAIGEAWEDVLLEIDTKLMKYAKEKKRSSDATIGDDFLELLMFGTPSDNLEKFLLHDLTENGLKKFGHSIELSYSNIQKLVLKKLQNIATSLFFYLIDIKGIALWKERFGELGMCPKAAEAALAGVGSYLMKALELQQVIDTSMKNFKAFFRWLYSVILRLSEEQIPADINKVTQQDLNFVAEFLKENFSAEWDLSKKKSFRIERVGQYLRYENLSFPPDTTGNPWLEFLEKNPALKDTNVIYPYYREKSLIQQYHLMRKAVEDAFSGPKNIFHESAKLWSNHILFRQDEAVSMKISYAMSSKQGYCLSLFTKDDLPTGQLHMLAESINNPGDTKSLCVTFNELPISQIGTASAAETCRSYKIFDVSFYNEETACILLVENHGIPGRLECPVIIQLPLLKLCEEWLRPVIPDGDAGICSNLTIVGGEKYVDKVGHKRLENCKAIKIAVSGSRKVACVLFVSRRQVRLFEMEVEEEEEETDETADHDETMKDFDREDPFNCRDNFTDPVDESNKEKSSPSFLL